MTQGAQHRHAVFFRQVQIQQDKIVFFDSDELQRFFTVIAAVHAVGQAPQAADDGFAQGAFIFNY